MLLDDGQTVGTVGPRGADGRCGIIDDVDTVDTRDNVSGVRTPVRPEPGATRVGTGADARLRFALDAAEVGYWELDLRSGRTERSPLHDRIFGHATLLPAWGYDTFLTYVHPDDRAAVDRAFRHACATGTEWEVECRITRADGAPRWIWARGAVSDEVDGVPARMVGVVIDVTRRKDADAAREAFLSSVSHDLKTPLASIMGYAQLARRRLGRLGDAGGAGGAGGVGGAEVAAVTTTIRGIEASAVRMRGLVDDLLELTRAQWGTALPLKPRPTDLAALVRRIVGDLHVPETHRVEVEGPDALRAEIDPDRIERVVSNLLSNALKYSPAGGTIRVCVTRADGADGADGADAIVSVQDAGVGIPADEVPHVFERFHRGRNVVGRIAGTGVGLASARQIAAAHAGTLAVESAEGVGSTFTLRLPLGSPRRGPRGPQGPQEPPDTPRAPTPPPDADAQPETAP